MKKQILVHDCGHIVQPGDLITFEDNEVNRESRIDLIGRTFEFVQTRGGIYDPTIRYVVYGIRDECDGLDVHVRSASRPERFGCSIQEIDDDC